MWGSILWTGLGDFPKFGWGPRGGGGVYALIGLPIRTEGLGWTEKKKRERVYSLAVHIHLDKENLNHPTAKYISQVCHEISYNQRIISVEE